MKLKYKNGNNMKKNVGNLNDEYFTLPDIANHCLDVTKKIISKYDNIDDFIWVEPAAGQCDFYNLLPKNKRIGIDIRPKTKSIKKTNYLKYNLPNKKLIVIGNPPFGHRGVLALEFINHSYSADYVAFILPMFFTSVGKGSIRYRVKGLNLIYEEILPDDSFYLKNGSKKEVHCCFQIWSKNHKKNNTEYSWYHNNGNEPFSEIIEVKTVSLAKNRECGLKWIYDKKADFYLSSTFFKPINVVYDFEDVLYKSGVAIIVKTKDKKLKNKIKKILVDTDWLKYSSIATNGCHHLGKSHIYQCIHDQLGG